MSYHKQALPEDADYREAEEEGSLYFAMARIEEEAQRLNTPPEQIAHVMGLVRAMVNYYP